MPIPNLLSKYGIADTTSKKTSSGLPNLISPEKLKAEKIASEQVQLDTQAKKDNSFGGILKSTILGIPKAAVNLYKPLVQQTVDFNKNLVKNTWEIYKQTPQKIIDDINEGTKSLNQGDFTQKTGRTSQQNIDVGKGILKAGGRTAGDIVAAVFAPISAAIGSVLESTGGQKLIDKGGNIIADGSGITDKAWFQKFAIEHPNAGEDFNRILNLVMAKREKGTIDPARMVDEIHSVAKDIVSKAEKATPTETNLGTLSKPEEPKFTVHEPTPEVVSLNEPIQLKNEKPLSAGPTIIDQPTHSIRTVMEGLSSGGYSADQVSKIMTKLFDTTPSGEFLPRDVADEAAKITPANERPAGTSIIRIKEQKPIKTPEITKTPPKSRLSVENSILKAPETSKTAITEVSTPKVNNEPLSGNKTSGLAKSIEAKAIESKLTEGFGHLAEYDSSTLKEQAQLSADLINSGIEKARAVIRGEKALPNRLRGSALIVAMEDYLSKNPDPIIAHELANSPLTSGVSQSASEIGLMQNRTLDSINAKFREIK